jgi:upstream activation factor subunit UAF30
MMLSHHSVSGWTGCICIAALTIMPCSKWKTQQVKNTQEDPDGEKAKARAANNGFNRKQDVTPKLREFLGLPAEELISRSEVTKFITKYIAEQGLKHPENGRQIVLDGKLRELLAPPAEVVVTYLNLQKYLSPHYIKKEA